MTCVPASSVSILTNLASTIAEQVGPPSQEILVWLVNYIVSFAFRFACCSMLIGSVRIPLCWKCTVKQVRRSTWYTIADGVQSLWRLH